jgi:hypothetical protein
MPDQDASTLSPLIVTFLSGSERGPVEIAFGVEMNMWPPLASPSSFISPSALARESVDLREKLSAWAKRYDLLLKDKKINPLDCDPEKVKELWLELARWGRWLYSELFYSGNLDLQDWAEKLKKMKGRCLTIDDQIGGIPWGLLYDEEIPEPLPADYINEMLKHFWITSYQVDFLPKYPRDRILWAPQLNNSDGTRLTITVNQHIEEHDGSQQGSFFKNISNRWFDTSTSQPLVPFKINTMKQEVLESIMSRQEPQHLLYFFCHHKKADGKWGKMGWKDLEDSKMIIEGEEVDEETAIGISEMLKNVKIKNFTYPPVVFLNACESAQTEVYDPVSFMVYFIERLKAYAFIGTEAQIPTAFADDFGRRFIKGYLRGEAIGKILFDARRSYAQECHNPFGLYYTLYGDRKVCLTQSFKEMTS